MAKGRLGNCVIGLAGVALALSCGRTSSRPGESDAKPGQSDRAAGGASDGGGQGTSSNEGGVSGGVGAGGEGAVSLLEPVVLFEDSTSDLQVVADREGNAMVAVGLGGNDVKFAHWHALDQ